MNRLVALALLLSVTVVSGCAAGNHPESRAYTPAETQQLALEDLNRRGLSYDEYQARKARLMAQPELQRVHAFDNRGEYNAEVNLPNRVRQG
ncbi:hypothetical protein [Pseudomonas huanghezhanensis]|uniref:hypothetical protein n=1 Tax=Pseudomonas huanghezhanensis TaxID=3002903 RepID=UPI002285DF14|nr:hypothetical protein [Pseudomonas sp. BSw22131]